MTESVAINSQDYDVYADVSMADAYLDAAAHADTWRALEAIDKARYLVTATRIINRQVWKGTLVTVDQPLAFPRNDMSITPDPILDDSDIPVDVDNASIELALALADGSDVQHQQTGTERIRSYTAGSVSITNFRGIDTPTRFPQIVQELLKPYLAGGGVFGAKATGVDTETVFPVELGHSTGGI